MSGQASIEDIDVHALVARLQSHVLGDGTDMTEAEVNAAVILLDKVLPDRQAIQVSINGDGFEFDIDGLEDIGVQLKLVKPGPGKPAA